MKSIITLVVCLTFSFQSVYSQEFTRCATTDAITSKAQIDPDYLNRLNQVYEQIEQFTQNNTSRFTGEVYRIPVVVHVIYNNDQQNISDQLIEEQIEILNQDFRRLNEDASQTREEFLDVAGDAGIEFYLADFDPDGNPTNGITRTETSVNSFVLSIFDGSFTMKHTDEGGADAWDVNKYMNIWVCNLAIFGFPGVLGFATPPESAPNWPNGNGAGPDEDGVVIHYDVFGPRPNATGALASVNKGRTATHEVGHFLGLRHIWGDGDCNEDDGLSDTPSAAEASQQTCDFNANSCTDSPEDFPDMIENYMDYSDENCMNMFTNQQVDAMRFVIENFRQDLLLSNSSNILEEQLSLYPNPVHDFLNLQSNDSADKAYQTTLRDISGRVVKVFEPGATKFDLSFLNSGIYTIQIESNDKIIVHKIIKN